MWINRSYTCSRTQTTTEQMMRTEIAVKHFQGHDVNVILDKHKG